MTPYYDHAGITIYHGDCREILPGLESVDLVLTDPPYGMDWDGRISAGGHSPGLKSSNYGKTIKGDKEPFEPEFLLHFPYVVIWGFHHFAAKLPPGSVLVWIKRFDHAYGSFLSDADLAWMKGGHGVYCKRDTSSFADTKNRQHPTIKPKNIMKWCIEKSKSTGTILDPFAGSCTTLVAAKELGRRAIGIEIEEKYCEIGAKRLAQEVLPL